MGTYYVIVNIFTVTQMGAGVVLSVFVCAQVMKIYKRNDSNFLSFHNIRSLCTFVTASNSLHQCIMVLGNNGMHYGPFRLDRNTETTIHYMANFGFFGADWMCGGHYHFLMVMSNNNIDTPSMFNYFHCTNRCLSKM